MTVENAQKKKYFCYLQNRIFLLNYSQIKKFVVNILKELFQEKFWKSSFKF